MERTRKWALAWLVPPQLVLVGCGLGPCFEGQLRVELGEVIPGSDCLFEDWPGEMEFVVEAIRSTENAGNTCEAQQVHYLPLPEGSRSGGAVVSSSAPTTGMPVGFMESITFESVPGADGCQLLVRGELRMTETYDDFGSAIDASGNGDVDAFFVRYTYNGIGDCEELISGPRQGDRWICSNTHQARVTQL